VIPQVRFYPYILSETQSKKLAISNERIWAIRRGVTSVRQFSGCQITAGLQNDCEGRRKIPTMLQVLFSIQCICFTKTLVSNMGAPILPLASGAI